MSDYFLTYLWTWMECFSAILLFDAFSARKRNRVVHWITVTAVAFLDATLLNFAATTMPNYSKIVIVLALFFSLHRLLYTSNGIFSLYISIIFYATICCMDNCWYTLLLLIWLVLLHFPIQPSRAGSAWQRAPRGADRPSGK